MASGKWRLLFWILLERHARLNYRNPAVTEQMFEMTSYWLNDIGIDGFRIDAAKHLIEEGQQIENTEATHEWFKGFYTFYKNENPNAYTVGEVYGAGAFIATRYAQQMDQHFNFEGNGIVNSVNGETNTGINKRLDFHTQRHYRRKHATF
jgi:glycosidase